MGRLNVLLFMITTMQRPEEGEVRVLVSAMGVTALGTQVTGTVDAVAKDSIGFLRGDRVAFRADAPVGARVIVAEDELIGVPADVSLDAAAAIFPCALLARSVVRQVRSIARGDRVQVADTSVVAPFLRAWARHLGADVVDDESDVRLDGRDIRAALALRSGHGSAQQAAADVFAAIRAGAFDEVALSTPDEARSGSRAPVLLHPTEVTLAA